MYVYKYIYSSYILILHTLYYIFIYIIYVIKKNYTNKTKEKGWKKENQYLFHHNT